MAGDNALGSARSANLRAGFRHGFLVGVIVWLNLNSKKEVDELYRRWQQAGAKIVSEPEDKPWRLREFRVADLDDNQLRVFYDFSSEPPQEHA